MSRNPSYRHAAVRWLLLCALVAFSHVLMTTSGHAQARSSSTMNGVTVTVVGSGSQTVEPHQDGARAVLNGMEVIALKDQITVDGKTYGVKPYKEVILEAVDQWGFRVSADGNTIHEISDFDGLKVAAERGNATALNNLGVHYLQGDGVEKDVDRAIELYRKAGEKGSAQAQSNLANLYWYGREDVSRNPSLAVFWAKKAAEQDSEDVLFILARAFETGDGAAENMETAVKWYEKAAAAGQASGLNNLAYFYLKGEVVEQNAEKAVELYKKASDLGNSLASNNLGIIYRNGSEVPKNLQLSAQYFEKAVEQNHPGAADSLAKVMAQLNEPQPSADPVPVVTVADSAPQTPQTPQTPPTLPQPATPAADEPPPLVSPAPAAAPATALPPPLPQKQIFFAVNGQRQGPVNEDELARRITSGELDGQTMIWQKGMDNWAAIADVEEYAKLIVQPVLPPPPQQQFFLVLQGQQQGPFDPQQIKAMADAGQVAPDTLVWTEGMSDWQALKSQPVLANLIPANRTPPALPNQTTTPGMATPGLTTTPGLATPGLNTPATTGANTGQQFRVRSYCSATGKEGFGTGSTQQAAAQAAIKQCVANGGLPNCCPNSVTLVQ